MKVRRSLLKDTVSVQTHQGTSAAGPSLADAVSVNALVQQKRRLVRAADGTEQISELTLILHPDDETTFTPESKVTYGGRASRVLSVIPSRVRGYTTHVTVYCS